MYSSISLLLSNMDQACQTTRQDTHFINTLPLVTTYHASSMPPIAPEGLLVGGLISGHDFCVEQEAAQPLISCLLVWIDHSGR